MDSQNFMTIKRFWWQILKLWMSINFPWGHVRSHKNSGPIGSAVFTFIGYKQTDSQVLIYFNALIVRIRNLHLQLFNFFSNFLFLLNHNTLWPPGNLAGGHSRQIFQRKLIQLSIESFKSKYLNILMI